MDASTYYLLRQLEENSELLRKLNSPNVFTLEFLISLLFSIIPSIVALCIAGGIGRFIKPYFGIKSELEILELRRFRQKHHVWRLVVVNNGREIAKNVQVDVIRMHDENILRENFLPMPLPWTHVNKENRDILPKQTVYLDVFYHKINSPDDVHIATRFGRDIDNFRKFRIGKSKFLLTFYEQGGNSFNREIEVSWEGGLFLDARLQGSKWVLGTKKGSFTNI